MVVKFTFENPGRLFLEVSLCLKLLLTNYYWWKLEVAICSPISWNYEGSFKPLSFYRASERSAIWQGLNIGKPLNINIMSNKLKNWIALMLNFLKNEFNHMLVTVKTPDRFRSRSLGHSLKMPLHGFSEFAGVVCQADHFWFTVKNVYPNLCNQFISIILITIILYQLIRRSCVSVLYGVINTFVPWLLVRWTQYYKLLDFELATLLLNRGH